MEVTLYSECEYEEIEKLILSRLKELRSVLQDEHDVIVPEKCDDFLIRCLRLKDADLEKAVKLVLAFQTALTDIMDWEAELKPSIYKHFYHHGMIIPLLKKDAAGRRITVMRLSEWDPKKASFDEVITCIWMMSQYANSSSVELQRLGTVTIWDFNNFTLQQAWAIKQWRLPALGKMAQKGIGGRVKAFHVVNHPRIATVIYAGVKPFLSEKFKKRIFFHGDVQSLMDHLGAEGMPDYLGGSVQHEKTVDRGFIRDLLGYDNYFEEMVNNQFPIK